jgi:proteasome assembly chaperone (PAC2) family protein
LEVNYLGEPELDEPNMIAAWPGMGYLAKISADYLRRRLKAELFAEVTYYHNVLVYNKGLADLAPIRHCLYAAPEDNLIICVGDAQPSIPEESLRLAEQIVGIAKRFNVKRIYTMAAFPGDIKYANVPQHISSKAVLEKLTRLLGIEIDTTQLQKRAKKIDASIRRRLDLFEEEEELVRDDEKKLGYIS